MRLAAKLASQKNYVNLDNEDLKLLALKPIFQHLSQKIISYRHDWISLKHCEIGLLATQDFDRVCKLISKAKVSLVILDENSLDQLNSESFLKLLTALKNPNIKSISLEKNNLRKMLKKHATIFSELFHSKLWLRVNLKHNQLTDNTLAELGKHCKIAKLSLAGNEFGNTSLRSFAANNYLTELDILSNELLKNKIEINKRELKIKEFNFIEKVIAILQGARQPASYFYQLPAEILVLIVCFAANNIRSDEFIRDTVDVMLSSISKNWLTGITKGDKEVVIFKESSLFFAQRKTGINQSLRSEKEHNFLKPSNFL